MSHAPTRGGVDSVLARCLLDADFLHAVGSDPSSALESYDLSPSEREQFETLDFASVRHFAGFITKVQHNHLWQWFPFTRALVKCHGREIEVFTAYHARHLQVRAGGGSRADKIAAFLDFLDDYAARPGLAGVRDVLRHERTQWEMETRPPADPTDRQRPSSGPFFDRVPAPRGELRAARFEYSPFEISRQISKGELDTSQMVPQPQSVLYWMEPGAGRLRILETDALTAALLSEVDGRSSVREVVGRTGLETDPETLARLRPIFQGAAESGLIALGAGGPAG